MPYNPLEGLNLPAGQYLPPEYSQQMMEQLQIGQQRAEQEQMRRFLEGINAMGRLYTGSALRGGIQQVLGPQMERQQQLLGNIALQGAGLGREERLGEVARAYGTSEREAQQTWQAAQNELNREYQRWQVGQQIGEAKRKERLKGRFGTQLGNLLPSLAGGLLSRGVTSLFGGLPSLLGLGREAATTYGGSPPASLSLGGGYGAGYGTNMFGRNLGYGD